MLRRVLSAVSIAFIGVLVLSGVAAGYPPPAAVPAGISGANIFLLNGSPAVVAGEPFDFSGSGFTPNEGVGIDLSFSGPSGLRGTAGLARLAAPAHFETTADAGGSFTQSITWDAVGVLSMTAVGHLSGHTVTSSIAIVDPSARPGAGGTGGIGDSSGNNGTAGNGSSGGIGNVEVNGSADNGSSGGGVAGSEGDGGGLAYTGASLAGPIAVGVVALSAGLVLLFFGTRGVRRRKTTQGR